MRKTLVEIRIYHKGRDVEVLTLYPTTLWEFKSFVKLTRHQHPESKVQVKWTMCFSQQGKERIVELMWVRHGHRSENTITANFFGGLNISDFREGYFCAVKHFLLELMINEADVDLQQLTSSIQTTLDTIWKPIVE